MRSLITTIFLLLLISCSQEFKEKGSPEYIKEIQEFRDSRNNRLKDGSIWLKLDGLYWLDQGKNSIGSAKNNSIIFPDDTPVKIADIELTGDSLNIVVNPNVDLLIDSVKTKSVKIRHDQQENTSVMRLGKYWWYIIKRDQNKYGIRLINDEHTQLKTFTEVPAFPVNEDWRIEADWVKYDEPKILEIPSVIGTTSRDTSYGKFVFDFEGSEQSLVASGKGPNFFIIFADRTNGEETYGAGRFLVANYDSTLKKVILDFNKAYNPPCSFSKYATCPLPPKENQLKIKVTAGERFEGHH